MCGRYYADETMADVLRRMTGDMDGGLNLKRGDICPSQSAYVLTAGKAASVPGDRKPSAVLRQMRWGFPGHQGKGLVINARAESVLERRMFCDSVLYRRCVIPAKLFYEWDSSGNKAEFQRSDASVLLMAGFYQRFDDTDRFVILTTQANASVSPVHDRMPLILEVSEVGKWLYDDSFVACALHKKPVLLKRHQDYEQMRLFP